MTIEARNVPLAQVLDRLAEASGMKVTYEGERPSTAVTVSVKGLSEVAAVVQLMEGLGISYFIRTDDSGSGVDVLIISGAAAAAAVSHPDGSPRTSRAPGKSRSRSTKAPPPMPQKPKRPRLPRRISTLQCVTWVCRRSSFLRAPPTRSRDR